MGGNFLIAAVLLMGSFVFVRTGVAYTGVTAQEKAKAQKLIQQKQSKQAQDRQDRYGRVESMIKKHVDDQRSSEELRNANDASLYVNLVEFHDHDGDGVVDHPTENTKASKLEKLFDAKKDPDLRKFYVFEESYKGFKTPAGKEKKEVVMRHLRRRVQKKKAGQARAVGDEYAKGVLSNITTDQGHVTVDLAEDALRFMHKKERSIQEAQFQRKRIERLEKFRAYNRSIQEARIKSSFRTKALKGSEKSATDISDQLDIRKKSNYKFTAELIGTQKERHEQTHKFYKVLEEYKKRHPDCLKTDWTCYVDKRGRIIKQKISDTYQAAEQIGDASEYYLQASLEAKKKGKAFWKKLPGEVENMSRREQQAIKQYRTREKKRWAVMKRLIEKKKQYRLQNGKVVEREIATGELSTEERIRAMSRSSAFEDARQGRIELQELIKNRGKGGFKTLDY